MAEESPILRLHDLKPAPGSKRVEALVEKGAVRPRRLVKILGDGDVTKAFNITADKWSASAEAKITAAGGTISAK